MKYKEFTVTTTDEAEELVADIFWNYTDFGVAVSAIKDVIELTENRKDTFDYIDGAVFSGEESVSLVKGYFPIGTADKDIVSITRDLEELKVRAAGFIDVGSLEIVSRTVDGEDWIKVWRKHFKPIEFSTITVCPEWIKYTGDKQVVLIGSNTAFGTGEHETTSMCVGFLEKYVKAGDVVIDVGTGSGILGIAAARLGAKKVYMTDNDEKAVAAANYNVKLNGVQDKCYPLKADLLDGVKVEGDVVVANITAEILALLSKDVLGYIRKNGVLIMSGIISDRLDFVLDTYLPLGFEKIESKTVGEWSAVVLKYVAR